MSATIMVVLDEASVNSLQLVQQLQATGEMERRSKGIYLIENTACDRVFDVTNKFPEDVIKVEVI